MTDSGLKIFLEQKYHEYNRPKFITSDPISIPHQFRKKEDREISGFLAATIAWGQRPTIIKNANKLMKMMDDSPHDFILNFSEDDLIPFKKFVHRTFNGTDCIFFLQSLQNIYRNHEGLEKVFSTAIKPADKTAANGFRNLKKIFFEIPHHARSVKHVPDIQKKSAAKRINMFLRWMVRKDHHGVDFGIWKMIKPLQLICPLDVHSARVARKLGLLKRPQNDWEAAVQLTAQLKHFDANDPVKYDFALFGLGVFEKF